MTKHFLAATALALLLGAPAFADDKGRVGLDRSVDQPVQVPTTGADPMRTGSKAVPGSAVGEVEATTSGAAQRTVQPVQEPTTGADPARTGSKAAPGSATGSPGGDVGANTGAAVGSGSDQPVQVPTTGADPMRTGSKGVSGSATGSPAGGAGSERR